MSDHVTSGEPTTASAETAGAAPVAASSGNSAPIGSFGTAKGSGLSRGKRATPPAAASAAAPAATGSYQPTSVEVITSQSEYKNPFTGETTVRAPVNEPAPQAALQATETAVKAIAPTPGQSAAAPESPAPAATPAPAVAPAAAPADELFPFPPSSEASAPARPAAASAETAPAVSEKAELNILPPADVKRPAVSWGEEGVRDERPTFRPERREAKPFEARQPKSFPPREPKAFVPHEPKPFQPREPRAPRPDSANGSKSANHNGRDQRSRDRRPAAAAPAKKSGGFLGWLKGLFGAEPAAIEQSRPGADRGDQRRDDGEPRHNRRRHRGGRGRSGYQGENRGPRPEGQQHGDQSRHEGGQSGERRFEGGGGGRRRSRGGRGRGRNGGGPRPEGHQGGGAI
jgi:translation initiation factor IF-2